MLLCVVQKARLTSRLHFFQLIFKDIYFQSVLCDSPKSSFEGQKLWYEERRTTRGGGLGPPPPHPPPSARLLFIGFSVDCPTFHLFGPFLLKQIKILITLNTIIIALNQTNYCFKLL